MADAEDNALQPWQQFEAQRDWRKFKKIWKDHVEDMLRTFPKSAMKEPICQLYYSFDLFIKYFPDAEARSEELQEMKQTIKAIDRVLECSPEERAAWRAKLKAERDEEKGTERG